MIESYFNESRSRSLSKPFYFYAAAISVVTGIVPVSVYTQWAPTIDMMAIFIFVAALANAFQAHLKRTPGANIILPGSLYYRSTGLHDMLYQANLIRSTGRGANPHRADHFHAAAVFPDGGSAQDLSRSSVAIGRTVSKAQAGAGSDGTAVCS
jgi:hypothetical protein